MHAASPSQDQPPIITPDDRPDDDHDVSTSDASTAGGPSKHGRLTKSMQAIAKAKLDRWFMICAANSKDPCFDHMPWNAYMPSACDELIRTFRTVRDVDAFATIFRDSDWPESDADSAALCEYVRALNVSFDKMFVKAEQKRAERVAKVRERVRTRTRVCV